MMKRLLALLLALIMALGMAACSESADVDEPKDGNKEVDKPEVETEDPVTEETETEEIPVELPKIEADEDAHHINSYGFGSWTVNYLQEEDSMEYYYVDEAGEKVSLTEEEINAMLDTPVTICGDDVLTNRMLQHYYVETMYNFSSYYQDYLAYIMDTSLPLDGQMNEAMGDGTETWQQTFLEDALNTYQMTIALVKEAKTNGFTLTEEQQEQMDMACDLDTQALTYGYADGQTLVKAMLGAYATVEAYQQYVEDTLIANFYMESLTAEMEVTEEEAEAYYEENTDLFTGEYAKGNVDVRHILVETEEEANRILNEWKNGAATEESFAELATANTTDPGSQQTGGLYEGVFPGQMVPTFDAWCFDETRAAGDTGIVATDYGYHIMYFVGESDSWMEAAKNEILAKELEKIQEELVAKYELTVKMSDIVLLEKASVPES